MNDLEYKLDVKTIKLHGDDRVKYANMIFGKAS